MEKQSYLDKFKRCVNEYNRKSGSVIEEAAPMPDGPMRNEPMGGANEPMPDAPMNGGGEMGGNMPMNGNGDGQEPMGFNPEGVDDNAPIEGMSGDVKPDEQPEPEQQEMGEEDEVIDVDDLTSAQEKTEKKVDALADKFEKTMEVLSVLAQKIKDSDEHTNKYLEDIKSEIEKRNPTPMQRMSMRAAKSAPYGMTPTEYMQNYAPENYSMEDDNNGEGDEQYTITKSDIDNFSDYQAVARELGANRMGLMEILGLENK